MVESKLVKAGLWETASGLRMARGQVWGPALWWVAGWELVAAEAEFRGSRLSFCHPLRRRLGWGGGGWTGSLAAAGRQCD